MARSLSICAMLLLVAVMATTGVPARQHHPPPPPVSTAVAALPPPPADIKKQQLKNIIDALIGAGDFAGWINVLSSSNPSSLPLTATLFVPSNDAVSQFPSTTATGMNLDPFVVPYHIVPQRFSFSDLQQFPIFTRLPTLFPSKYILITNNSRLNFTINNCRITHPDILVNAAFSVHGINNLLDYTLYGGNGSLFSPPPPPPPPPTGSTSSDPAFAPAPNDTPPDSPEEEESIIDLSSTASCSCNDFILTLLIVSVYASKIR